jgi:hypothetical protein
VRTAVLDGPDSTDPPGGPVLAEGVRDGAGVHLGQQRDLLLGGPDDQHDVSDADDVHRAGTAHALPGDDLDEAVALPQAALLGHACRDQQHDGDEPEGEDEPDDHPRHRAGPLTVGSATARAAAARVPVRSLIRTSRARRRRRRSRSR